MPTAQVEALVDRVDRLEQVADVRALVDLLVFPPPGPAGQPQVPLQRPGPP
jgi:hypothetical protein